jgi:hypothetical protein
MRHFNGECIEVNYRNRKHSRFFSVKEYEAMRARGAKGTLYRAPPVQDLTTHGRACRPGSVSISDREQYDQQMRELLGLDWLMGSEQVTPG